MIARSIAASLAIILLCVVICAGMVPRAAVAALSRGACCRPAPLLKRPGRLFLSSRAEADESSGQYRKHYALTGTGSRSRVLMETDTGHKLQTDVPKPMGGGDAAPQPVEHLLASLLGCTQATALFVGRMMEPRLLIDKMEFDVRAYRDERGALQLPIDEVPPIPARLQCVSGTVTVHLKKGAAASDGQLRILGEQTEARCPVANMMHASGCKMEIEWVNGSESAPK